ncbi:hypothetical protein HY971_01240 [Candidatus Kaiserbacteria bacterium]|nr:hypothetical protein [Candidatus Kaiserbacteria bacterium]
MNKSLAVSGASLLISALIIPAVVLAAEVRVGESPSFSSSETVKNDLYLAGGNVSSSGKVNGDLGIAGGTIIVSGPVSQDLAIGGGSITVTAEIGDDVRVGGGNIFLNGRVGNDVVVGGGQTTIAGAGIGGDVLWGGGMLRVDAPVGGDMQLAGGEVVINAPVHGNVSFKGQKLTLGKDAVIDGNLDYSAQKEATIEAGAVVKGKTTYEQQKTATPAISGKGIIALLSLLFLGKFLALLVFALALGLFFRRYAEALVSNAITQPLLETGRGLIVLIVLPVVSVMLLVTLIGVPLGILGFLAFGILLLVASPLAAVIVGSVVHKWIFKPAEYQVAWQTILLGVAIYTVLGFIPLVGGIAKFVLILLAVGSMMKIKWDMAKEWR